MSLIHPSAIVDPSAELGDGVEIGPFCIVGPDVKIGSGTRLLSNAHICPHTRIGANNVIHMGAVVGHDPQFIGFDSSTLNYTILGDGNVLREYVTIHRPIKPGEETRIGNNCYLMAMTHVAHDCRLGDNVILTNYTGVSGHVEIGDRAVFSGYVAVHQFVRIGKMAMISGHARVLKDVPPFLICEEDSRLVGINVVGLRRAGVGAEVRSEIKKAYKLVFRSGFSVSHGLSVLEEEWKGREMPPELACFVEFCRNPGRRGLSRGPREGEEILTEGIEE